MNIKKLLMFLVLINFSLSAAAQQPGHGDSGNEQQHGGQMKGSEQMQGGHGRMLMSHTRHHFVRDNGIDESYKGEESPLLTALVDMGAAKTLYDSNCASCHGEKGLGDGIESSALDPAPTNIAGFAKMGMAKDDYLLWTLSEGGQPVASDMPAFKGVLSRDEIWLVIAYLRQL
mgnify:CR=1 FL=1|tara:strand:- start:184 stop:702 length:519 start_codon:yes stop_codon:yes gene_type:complete